MRPAAGRHGIINRRVARSPAPERPPRDEKLHRAPLRLARPRSGVVGAVRWLVAAGLLGLAALLLLSGQPPATAAPTTTVLVAAHDLRGGVSLTRADLHLARLPSGLLPSGALRAVSAALGRSPSGPVRRGEPLTDVRLLGPALLRASGAGALVAAPVRIADPGAVALLRPGDRVDVIAGAGTAPGGGPARVVAPDLVVIGVPPGGADGAAEGALVVLAASPAVAARLVGTAATARLSVTVHGR